MQIGLLDFWIFLSFFGVFLRFVDISVLHFTCVGMGFRFNCDMVLFWGVSVECSD